MDQFVGIGRDDRDKLCDIQHQSAFLSEVRQIWHGGQGYEQASDIADDYCTDLHKSATLCYEPPDVHSEMEAKKAAYLIKQHRDANHGRNNIMEIEILYYYLDDSVRAILGRVPDEDEQVILQYDVITHGQVYIISRELFEITGVDLKTYAKEIDISMAKEWTS